MKVVSVRTVGIVRDGRAVVLYEIDVWISTGNGVMLHTLRRELVLPMEDKE